MPDLYLWQVSYINALVETDASLKTCRVYEAIAAVEQRLLSPIEPGSPESQALIIAQANLLRLKADLSRQPNGKGHSKRAA
jgi:hypothetical protein